MQSKTTTIRYYIETPEGFVYGTQKKYCKRGSTKYKRFKKSKSKYEPPTISYYTCKFTNKIEFACRFRLHWLVDFIEHWDYDISKITIKKIRTQRNYLTRKVPFERLLARFDAIRHCMPFKIDDKIPSDY